MNESDQMFLAVLTQDFTLVLQVMLKIIAGLFFSTDAITIYIVLALGFLIFWLKSKIETH
jgi:hypothetical protein